MPPFSPGDRLIVLGAGATRGALFGDQFTPMCEPPLNSDFFTQLQRITAPERRRKLVAAVIKDVVGLFGSNFSLTLEDYFTQLEFLSEAIKLSPPGGGGITASDLRENRERLLAAVSMVLEVSTDAAIRTAGGCLLHQALVGDLKVKDTIISFNYDCVIDHALRQSTAGLWSAKYGYTFPKPDRISGHQFWDAKPAASSATAGVNLLKLHGSQHWQLPPLSDLPDEIKLKQRLYTQYGNPRFTIIPPVWNKAAAQDPIFRQLWTNAERAIRAARHIAVVGFSFVETDLPVESLFRVALAKGPRLESLVIANPSGRDRDRVRRVFAKSLEDGAVVRQYGGFEDFVAAFPSCMRS